jgi:cellulose synthase (UDP-forming)
MERTMTESPACREFESGDGVLLKLLRFSILALGIFFLAFAGILELTCPQQAVLGLLTVLLGIWMDRSSTSYLVTLTLMLCSIYSTFRYGFWRISPTVKVQWKWCFAIHCFQKPSQLAEKAISNQ